MPPEPTTIVYKRVQDVELYIDVYPPEAGAQDSAPAPAIVYFHGGGLTVGDRTSWFPQWLYERAARAGIAFISADYRLLPSSTGHDILADVVDLFAFLASGDLSASGCSVDAQRLVAVGTSAGGYCCFLAAMHATPQPAAILSLYGLGGDFLTPYFLTPKDKPFFLGRELLDPADFAPLMHPACHALPPVGGSPLTYHGPDSPTPGYPSNPRMQLTRVYLQEGTCLDYIAGAHAPSLSAALRPLVVPEQPLTDAERAGDLAAGRTARAEKVARLRAALPERVHALFPQLRVTRAWPRVFFAHGEADSAVHVQDAVHLCGLLRDAGVRAELRVVPGEEHSFDYQKGAEEKFGGGGLFDEAFGFVTEAVGV
ncbi:alpha/beta-hydrolase [Artomyces pyxidatus]|uniref:Alpha/beta-hydrolase n=1 Tax=Artomyces pyxidatus TaxID=48021 RepID=A0ACB8T0P0_9AGAM|nr:alpha/beta-hydrolase [Artomyces pyxidatus]